MRKSTKKGRDCRAERYLAEQLSQVTKNVNDVKEIVEKLVAAIEDLKKIVVAVKASRFRVPTNAVNCHQKCSS